MTKPDLHQPTQLRSQQTLQRILSSGTALISEQSYDEVTIADIAARAQISVGGFYSRFRNKEALFNKLQAQLAEETQNKILAALSDDWSSTNLYDLLHHMVAGNAELYEKYRGVLTVIHLRTRVSQSDGDNSAHQAYNNNIITQLETLLLLKREQIRHRQPKVAIRMAIACMASMLRDAVVFQDTNLYPQPTNIDTITRQVTQVMYQYLTGASE